MPTEIMGVQLLVVCFVAIAVISICVGIPGLIESIRESNDLRKFVEESNQVIWEMKMWQIERRQLMLQAETDKLIKERQWNIALSGSLRNE